MNRLVILALLAAGLAAGLATAQWSRQPPAAATLFATPRLLPEPALVGHDGAAVGTQRLSGQWDLLFFGFTRCPDICPMTLTRLRDVAERLPPRHTPRIWLVTVDPGHDTPEVLNRYVKFFDPGFNAITGSEEAIAEFAGALGVAYARIEDGDSYTMSHSAALFLIDPQGRYAGLFTTPHDWTQVESDLRRVIR